ncbi:uncharacterized protein F4822DRAFT_428700 [Hypoxylon trugodes]|uniref:uncharacterized protein n=1 Tax=Hypoxylon trugodes TaxID=326681 RepID=UPI002199BC54|nr:uncharacterized protein F4822DRAFT_428700 [Hypoxylon trugodes]KAI1390364.1 hypothetical protein F4822DRAFT_428700 [Hypoxylon trugodes]
MNQESDLTWRDASASRWAALVNQDFPLHPVLWNWSTALTPFERSSEACRQFNYLREETMRDPRDLITYPRYGDDGKPIDFHFLENYHTKVIDHPEIYVPLEYEPVVWPHIVVRLEEMYHAMLKINPGDQEGVQKFFGFFARPYVQLQEYWILINDKETSLFDSRRSEAILRNADLPKETDDNFADRRLLESAVSSGIKGKTVADLVAVDDLSVLHDRDRCRLRTVAGYLIMWGYDSPVLPRVVRWAGPQEGMHDEPPTIFEVLDRMNEADI